MLWQVLDEDRILRRFLEVILATLTHQLFSKECRWQPKILYFI